MKYVKELIKWKNHYNISIQIYDEQFNIYISRNDVDLYSCGGYDNINDAAQVALEWIKKVNKK